MIYINRFVVLFTIYKATFNNIMNKKDVYKRQRFDFGKHFVLQTYHLFQYPYNKKTISVPVWLTRNVFYYHTPLFKGNAHLKTGIEFLYLTKYYAPAWNPNIQYFVVSENKLRCV